MLVVVLDELWLTEPEARTTKSYISTVTLESQPGNQDHTHQTMRHSAALAD